jgi:NAD(P)-dependent dehydrogenase (short-subunit alcohol dehydrogenase family)
MSVPDTKLRLAGKVAIVTGAASGIGRAIAETFCAHGASVHALDVNAAGVEDAARGMSGQAGSVTPGACDVSSFDDVDRVFARILGRGPVDILVNNAGIAHIGNAQDTTGDDLDRLYAVNVKGVYHCIHAIIGAMKARRSGVIVNMASIAASSGLANRFAYSMTKGAVLAMTYSVARDYVADGIRCVSISPARIHTPFVDGFLAKHYPGREREMFDKLAATQPVGRMGTPREVADLALFLCSDEAQFATGTDYPLDGGFLRLHG